MKFDTIATGVLSLGSLVGSSLAFTNPIRKPGGADPFVTYSGDGYYYMMSTSWTNLEIARSKTIEGLKTAEKKVIYTSTDPSRCCNIWAPEVHYVGSNWYVYFTAGEDGSNNLGGQRPHALKGGATPWDDFTYAGQMMDEWAIDGTVVRFNDFGNYFASSCQHGVTHQSICLQKLNDDNVSLTGPISLISQPTEPWETSEVPVNEGPAALYAGGKTMIGYSASYCWTPDYCVGMLTWDGKTDPMQVSAWTKSNGCLLSSGSGNYGTGHNSFFQSASGDETWIAYHATDNPQGACDNNRYAMIQKVNIGSDGSVSFEDPVDFETEIPEPK